MAAADRRVAARMALGVVAGIVCLTLVLAGASMGLTGSVAFSQPSPSGSPSGGGGNDPAIFLLNPSAAYKPAADVQEPASPSTDEPFDPPKISDKFDGQDTAYHVVAVGKNLPANVLIEAYYQESGANEVTVGQLSPVPGSPDTYEFFWSVPSSIRAINSGLFIVRAFAQTPTGFDEIANDEVEVRMQHVISSWIVPPEGLIAEAETVELVWPSQNGPLGFYKGANPGATWKTVVHGTASGIPPDQADDDPPSTGADQIRVFYSTTPVGQPPEFSQCASTNLGVNGSGPEGTKRWGTTCTLNGQDRPSQLTALAAVAMQDHDPSGPNNGAEPVYSQESADVHRIQPYLQRVEDLEIDLESVITAHQLSRRHVSAGTSCLAYKATVTDALDRPVQGANVDIHMRGPSDQAVIGDETRNGSAQSAKQKPQKDHSSEGSTRCDTFALRNEHGEHNVPGAPDIKHIESSVGTGSGGATVTFGQWLFYVYSPVVGDTEISAWVDDEAILNDSEKRELDDDTLEAAEASATNFAQWFSSAPAVTIDPLGATAATGDCQRFVVRVRGGARAVRDANVDVHATGPNNELDFCNPSDASPRRAPLDGTGHNAEDDGEVTHAGEPPVAQHTEGETNDQGNFIVGIRSPVPGDTTLTAWYDAGEAPFDNDEQGSGEANASATTNWVESTGDAAISFLNPSPYGGAGTNVGKKQDVDAAYHIVTRVSSVVPVPGVELFYRFGSDPLVKIGDATRVGSTDAWEIYWPVEVTDGTYTLIARIPGTGIETEQSVTVNNTPPTAPDPRDVPFETVEITAPLGGDRATFVRGNLTVRGVASAGAEGVHLFYTKAGSSTTPASGAWTQCGTSTLPSGSAPKEFTLDCSLAGSDQPAMVTGIAVIAYDCAQGNCTVQRTSHSGDAHRVFGAEANPLLTVEPAETAADVGTCQKFVVTLEDQTGQPIPGQNLDAHLTGPGNSGNFCSPPDGTGTDRRAPDQAGHLADGNETDEAYHDDGGTRTHHTETETNGNGRFIFGIESRLGGDAQLTVWLDGNDDDVMGNDETRDISVMHWESDQGPCDISGTDGPDVLNGTSADEMICGFGGDDTIKGRGGNDTIKGGGGNDLLRGNAGRDTVSGGAGNDRVFGGNKGDRLFGGSGNDRVQGHRGHDRLRGNSGRDRLNGGPGRDDCRGGRGRDRVRRCESGHRSVAARPRLI